MKLVCVATLIVSGAAGCVSSRATEDVSIANQSNTPQLFEAGAPAIRIAGDAISLSATSPNFVLGTISGAVGSAGQSSVFRGPLFTVRDADGANAREHLFDGSVRVRIEGDENRFARFYVTENDNGVSLGVFGVPATQALPVNGSAVYTGIGQIGEVDRGFGLPVDQAADSRVEVNFDTGVVNASLQVPENARSLLSSVDRLVARGLTIEGSRFSGTAVRAFLNGARVSETGANSGTGAAGRFYGPSDDEGPQEVGGVMHISDDDGLIFGLFVAD